MIKRTSVPKTPKAPTVRASVSAPPADAIPNPFKRYAIFVVLFIACVAGVGVCAYAFAPKPKVPAVPDIQVREGVDKNAVEDVISRVRETVAVSSSEMPAVASIQNIEEVRKQNPLIYRDAQEGDKVLLFKDKLVVYSTSQNRVLVVMPLNQPEAAPTETATTTASAPETATIEVRNGSTTPGVARTAGNKLKSLGMTVSAVNDASKHDYAKTVIYLAKGKSLPQTTAKIIEALGGEVVSEVPGEAATKADILVIVNK